MPLEIYKNSLPSSIIHNVIAIAAGKGGVGKSTVTVNLALALRFLGFQVGVLDADLYGPSIKKMMLPDQLPIKKGESLFPALSQGIKVMSMAFFGSDEKARAIRAPVANSLISEFLEKISWGMLDFLLIDFPPGTGDIQLTLSQKAKISSALMVTTPQQVSSLDVMKAIDLFNIVKIPILGIVENMSYLELGKGQERIYPFGKGGGKNLAQSTGTSLLKEIPLEPLISTSCDQGISLFQQEGALDAKKAFIGLAEEIVHSLEIKEEPLLSEFKIMWKDM